MEHPNTCKCGSPLSEQARFCEACGEPVLKTPPAIPDETESQENKECICGVVMGESSRFCEACGKPLSNIAAPPPPPQIKIERCACGSSFNESSRFCETCGNPVPTELHEGKIEKLAVPPIPVAAKNPAILPPPPTVVVFKTETPKKSRASKIALAAVLLVLVGVGGFLAYNFLSPEKESAPVVAIEEEEEVLVANPLGIFPEKGPGGSLVAINFDNTVIGIRPEIRFLVNNNDAYVYRFIDSIAIIKLPFPLEGEIARIEVLRNEEVLASFDFGVEKTEITEIASSTIKPLRQVQTIVLAKGVSVTVPPGFVRQETKVTLSEVKNAPPVSISPNKPTFGYEIIIEGMEQLPDFIEVTMPYDSSLFDTRVPVQQQMVAFRRDASFDHYTMLPFVVNQATAQISIFTDHLTLIEWVVIGAVAIVAYKTSHLTEPLMYYIYDTPQGNFRLLYEKQKLEMAQGFDNDSWRRIFQPTSGLSVFYDLNHLVFVQDVGDVLETALKNFRSVGLKEPVKKPGWIRKEVVSPISVKIDSYMASSGDPCYFAETGYVHIPSSGTLLSFRGDGSTYSVLGHELFHRMQAEYYNFVQFKKDLPLYGKWSPHFWWIEASAEYAGCRVAWGDTKLENMFNGIPRHFLSLPINTTGLPAGFQNDYEYHAATFIYFLVEVKGYSFARMVENIAAGDPLITLDSFLRRENPAGDGLVGHYRDFARWAIFATGTYSSGFFKNFVPANFKNADNNDIAEKKDVIIVPENNELKITVEGTQGVFVEVVKMKENTKTQGNQTPMPEAVLQARESRQIKNPQKDEVLYFLAVNGAEENASVVVSIKTENKGKEEELVSHRFSFSGKYSAKLWAVKLDETVLTLTPDSITNGKVNEKYTLKIEGKNIPENVKSVYLEYDFGDFQSNARGKTKRIPIDKSRGFETELSYTYKEISRRKYSINIRMHDSTNDKEIAKVGGFVEFNTVRILGDRNIAVQISEGSIKEYKHLFVASADPPGEYSYQWDFGDGKKFSEVKRAGENSEVEYEYTKLQKNQKFDPKVLLKSVDGRELLAEDQILISVEEVKTDILFGVWEGTHGLSGGRYVYQIGPPEQAGYNYTLTILTWEGMRTDSREWEGPAPKLHATKKMTRIEGTKWDALHFSGNFIMDFMIMILSDNEISSMTQGNPFSMMTGKKEDYGMRMKRR